MSGLCRKWLESKYFGVLNLKKSAKTRHKNPSRPKPRGDSWKKVFTLPKLGKRGVFSEALEPKALWPLQLGLLSAPDKDQAHAPYRP